MVDRFLTCVDSAEIKLKRPPSSIEIFCELTHVYTYTVPVKNEYECCAILTSLLREDMIFGNDVLSHFTTKRQEGYLTYTEIFNTKFPGYKLDSG